MINLEKINKVIDEFEKNVFDLEKLAKTEKNIAEIHNQSIEMLKEIKNAYQAIVTLDKHGIELLDKVEENNKEVANSTKEITNKLQDIRSDYLRVSNCFELVEDISKRISSKFTSFEDSIKGNSIETNSIVKERTDNIINNINHYNSLIDDTLNKLKLDLLNQLYKSNENTNTRLYSLEQNITKYFKKINIYVFSFFGIVIALLIVLIILGI